MKLLTKIIIIGVCALGHNIFADSRNLLINSNFDFHSFNTHRLGKATSYQANYVPFWNASGAEVLIVKRDSHIDSKVLPPFSVPNGVMLNPGAKFWQFFTLPEAELFPKDRISLSFYCNQSKENALKASIKIMKIDSEDGTWSPREDFGLADKRTFVKQARGELVVAKSYDVSSKKIGGQTLKIADAEILGNFTPGKKSYSKDTNTVGIKVEFENTSDKPVWIFKPSLVRGSQAIKAVGNFRNAQDLYRSIPRTMQKLWKGEPLHIIVMGSSIDRGSANPPMYVYNEDQTSPDFKKPLCEAYKDTFSTKFFNEPELDAMFAQPRHYFSYAGRLKRELMKKFNYPANKILLNFMACDGSCVGEAHSGLKDYCELSIAPHPHMNGHKVGHSWKELYPELFKRPEGARPDLIIYGSGANEKTDTPNEIAVFEGAIRYIQRNYPGTEFVFCQFQNYGGYTSNIGDLQAIALRYQIPIVDYGIIGDRLCRIVNRYAVVNPDGHPQAGTHYIWFKQLEKFFETTAPIQSGIAQLHLPERIHHNTYNWEGEMTRYEAPSARFFRSNAVIIDDSAFNMWASFERVNKKAVNSIYVDGIKRGFGRAPFPKIDIRNSVFRYGDLSFGDRHIVEIEAKNPKFVGIDCKVALDRRYIGVESAYCNLSKKAEKFTSQTGYPYGKKVVTLKAGESATFDAIGNGFSIVWVDNPNNGKIKVAIDGKEKFIELTNKPFELLSKEKIYVENRKGIGNLAYGQHKITVTAVEKPVTLMGIYAYDMRSNQNNMRIVRGMASEGETIKFNPEFKATPIIYGVKAKDVTKSQATFLNSGNFEAIGE